MKHIAVVLLLLASVGAHANEDEAGAKRLFAEGRTQYAAKDFVHAKSTFLDAFKLSPMPLLLYNAAQAARRASEYDEALDLYRRYLIAAPDAPERAQCERYINDLVAYGAKSPRHEETAPEQPAPRVTPPPVVVAEAPPPPPPKKPRVGLIVGVTLGAAVVVGAAVTLGLVFTLHKGAPSTPLGDYKL